MACTILQVFVLSLAVISFAVATNHGGKGHESATTQRPPVQPSKPDTCPQPTAELLECVRRWACQYLIHLDLRCLLNLNGSPLVGNTVGGHLGGSGGGKLPGVLGNTGNALLGGSGGILGGLLG